MCVCVCVSRLKISLADQDTLIECDQMRLILGISCRVMVSKLD